MTADLFRRYFEALHGFSFGAWLLAALSFVAVIAGVSLRPSATRLPRRVGPALALLAFALSVSYWALFAWQQRWACDDAFISFRYARNWVSGQGLVYNPHERVEGYTNFLWTALVALGLELHVDPVVTTVVLGFASALAALCLVWKLSRDLSPRASMPLIAPAVVLLAGNRLFAQYTTSGLETMFAATLSLYALERAQSGRRLAAGCAGVLATLSHPDHALAYAALCGALAFEPPRGTSLRERARFLLPYLLPFALIYLPYFASKALYYGSLVPNTYYAKSANQAYFSQGLRYLAISATAAGFIGALPLIAVSLFVLRRSLLARYWLLLVLPYLYYVAKIGGDFMLGRLFILLLLPSVLLVDVGAQTLWHAASRRRRALTVLAAACAMTFVLRASVVGEFEKYHHVADEQSFYRLNTLAANGVASNLTDMANDFLPLLRGARAAPTMVTGCLGIFGYLTDLRIVDVFGLTDAHVARQPIAERGRPGHEKWISLAYAIESGGDFSEIAFWPEAFDKYVKFSVGTLDYSLLAHRPGPVATLAAGKNVHLPRIERQLRQYNAPSDPNELACDLWFFETFYFQHHEAEQRERFVAHGLQKQWLDPGVKDFLLVREGEHPKGYTRVRSFELDDPERDGFKGTIGTHAAWLARAARVNQMEIGNARGSFVDSFTEYAGDRAVGELWSREFVLSGDVIELYVAGGRHDDVAVMLEIEGKPVARATGCDLEIFGRRLWNVAAYKGQRATLRIRDQNTGGWGHILVDRVSEWRANAPAEASTGELAH